MQHLTLLLLLVVEGEVVGILGRHLVTEDGGVFDDLRAGGIVDRHVLL